MKLKITGIVIGVILLMIGISFATGYLDVFYTKTVGKAKQNAEREVYEETSSYVQGKRQEAAKIFIEYNKSDDSDTRAILKSQAAHQFAEFDTENLNDSRIRTFIENCKYGL